MSHVMVPAVVNHSRWRIRRTVAASVALVLSFSSIALLAAPSDAADPPTVVSLTFDDGNGDQMDAADIMKTRGMPGTFYVNSGTIGMSGFLTRAQLDALAADGNEIGGHTLNHTDLTTLPTEEARRQICIDRSNLIDWGFAPRSFAYPFAMLSPTAQQLAEECGYNSARGLGDIASRFGCEDCDKAESVPPEFPYETKALDQVDNTWTLQDFKDAVTNAEQAGGGWVQLTFHSFCGTSCGELSVSEAIFTDFLDWLQPRAASNNTTVATVGEVVGGAVKPAVSTPDPTPTDDPSGLTNPGFESLNESGFPMCWQQAGYGANTAAFSTVSPGRTGTRAGQVTVSGYTDGDAKLIPSLDLGTCAPPATPGKSYALRGWYTSTAVTQYAVYLRTTTGGWIYWTSSPWFAASSEYTQAVWTTPDIPEGYSGISFGLNLFSDGTLTTDDYSISATDAVPRTSAKVSPATPDGTAGWYTSRPTVALTLEAGSEAAVREYSFDGTTWLAYTAPIEVPDGEQSLRYRSRTSETIVEEAQTLAFKVDTAAPAAQPTFTKATRTVDATVVDTTSGPGTIEVREGGGAWEPFTGPRTMGPAATTLEFRATDAAGNLSPAVPLAVPAALGTSATVSPQDPDGLAGWYTSPPTVTLAVTAGDEAAVRQYSFDGTTWTDYTGPIAIPEGTSTLHYRSVGIDETETARTIPFKVDTGKPVVTPTFDKNTRSVDATASDENSAILSIEHRVDGGPWTSHTDPLVLGNDAASVDLRATDNAGNISTVETVDVPAALVTSATVSPAAPDGLAGWYVTSPEVTLTKISGAASAVTQYKLDEGPWTTYTEPVVIADGTSTLHYRTIDGDDTEATQTRDFTVDTGKPTVTTTFTTSTRTVTATAAEPTSGLASLEQRIDGGTWEAHTTPITVGNNASTIEFRATDNAGNVSTVETVDVPAALITSAAVSPAAPDGLADWYVTKPQITLTKVSGSASAVTQYSIDGGDWTTYTGPFQLDDGTPDLRYRTVDGDDTETAHSRGFKIDTGKPTVTTTFTKSTRTVTATAADTMSGLKSLERRIDGGAWGAHSTPIVVGDNASSIEFRATDNAGNVSPVETVNVPATLITSAAAAPATADGLAGWYVTKPQITLTKVSGAASAIQQYSIDGGDWTTYTGPFQLDDGTPDLRYRTVDGDDQEAAQTRSFKIDTGKPTVTTTFDKGARTVDGNASDSMSGLKSLEHRIDGGSWAAHSTSITVGDAASSIEFRATDNAGNVSPVRTVDVPAALITAAAVAPDAPDGPTGWYVTKPQITLTKVSGAASAIQQYKIGDGDWLTYEGPFNLDDGAQTVRYRTIDGEDVEDLHARDFQVDTAGPSLDISFDKATRTISAEANDTTSGVDRIEQRIAGGDWAEYTQPWIATDDATSVQFRAFDGAGNVSSTETLSAPERHATSSLRLALSTSSTTFGKPVKAILSVNVPPGEPAATGGVTVKIDGKPVGTTNLVNGAVAVTLAGGLSVRTHEISASYAGDATTKPASSAPMTLKIRKATPKVSFKLSTTRAQVGKTRVKVNAVVSVPGTSVRPSGRLQVLVDGKIVRKATLSAGRNGRLTITLPKFTKRKNVKISLKFAGSSTLEKATSKKKTLRIVS